MPNSFNILYMQSGGVTPVINATAAAVIGTAKQHSTINKVYAAKNGIVGALTEDLIDASSEPMHNLLGLKHTPGGAFGSSRYRLPDPTDNPKHYERLFEVFKAHNIQALLYNGGNGSMGALHHIHEASKLSDHPLTCVGIPKTIDNDLAVTDSSPGFGSAAKYVAVATQEVARDVQAMCDSSTKVFVLEVMGRNAGWLAASSGLAGDRSAGEAPHIILMPAVAFDAVAFHKKVKDCVRRLGHCIVVVSEGLRDKKGEFVSIKGLGANNRPRLGGIGPYLAEAIETKLKFKTRWAVADYLQRSARHIASLTDVQHAEAVGKSAVELAVKGNSGVMPVIVRRNDQPYRWGVGIIELKRVANKTKTVPKSFITRDGFGITASAKRYLRPLIKGEAYPPYKNGLPKYVTLKNKPVEKKLKSFKP